MTTFKRMVLVAIVLFSCVGCDQATKEAARVYLAPSSAISFFGDAFRLQYAEHSGAFLGLGSMMPAEIRSWIFIGVNGIGLAGLLVFVLFRRNQQLGNVIGLSLLIVLFLYFNTLGASAWVEWTAIAVTLCRMLHAAGMLMSADLNRPHPLRFIGALGTYLGGFSLGIALLRSVRS